MADANAQLSPEAKHEIVQVIKRRLGLLGALHFKSEVEKCACEPCKTIWQMITDQIDGQT